MQGEEDTVNIHGKDLRLSKIFWGAADGDKTVQITLKENYGGQYLGILNKLFAVAAQDFPDAKLDPDNTAAVALGGDYRKHMWGIEFKVGKDVAVPRNYANYQSEYLLSGGL